MEVLNVKDLNKSLGTFSLKNINFSMDSGFVYGIVGKNGAGKTTLIKCILDIYRYDGDVLVFGEKPSFEIKQKVAFVLEDCFLGDFLKLEDIDKVYASIYSTWDRSLFNQLAKRYQLPDNKVFGKFSKGMKMQLKIIAALSVHPKLMILDEPTSGLDPVVRESILELLQEYIAKDEGSILFSSHITTDLEKIADYILFIDDGQLILQGDMPTIIGDAGILKCSKEYFEELDENLIWRYRVLPYSVEVLVKNRQSFLRKNPDGVIDPLTLEDLMVFLIQGGKA